MTSTEFSCLSDRDFQNGAVLDEIAAVFKERNQLQKALDKQLGHCKRHNTFFDDEPCWQCVNEVVHVTAKGLQWK